MRPFLLALAFNLTTCGAAIPAGALAWHWLPLPAAPLAILFLVTALGGLAFASALWVAKQTIEC